MGPKRVMIVNIQTLLVEGVESLLNAEGEFLVTNTIFSNHGALIEAIEQSRPDVIIVDEASYLMEPAQLIAALGSIKEVRLIVLNSRISQIGIYDKHEYAISNPSQLIAAICWDLKMDLDGRGVS